jgi:hypothetical protein
MASARPCVTITGTDRRDRTSSPSIWRASSAARTSAGTTMFQHSAALQSSAPSGWAVHARRKRPIAAMFVGRSSAHASPAFSSKPGPMWSKLGVSITAPPTRLRPAILSSPYARR